MTPQEFEAALAGAQPVTYHATVCQSNRSLASLPCDCGALAELRRLQEARGMLSPWCPVRLATHEAGNP